ncbi:hypothetical protein EV700_2304 [Fluviicoccus keumensis]|uniref:Uncharacterized protein n=1 Tax=Fluviicoccus keumensis TaxID=1435465 RepID=A0A4Q7YNC7_9GAMM|nr:hypothetical protein [Fluviicoccus keumensis]RZU38373.1 hypothetical protein EV700_2304 [Fluviicoccus keumensis]
MLPNALNSKLKLLPLAAVLLLAACGGGGGSSSPAPVSTTISGTASKGTFKNAIVTAFQVKADGTKGDLIKTVRTGADGKYSIVVSGYTGPVLLEMSGDADTKMTCDIPAGCGGGVGFGQDVANPGLTLTSVLSGLPGGVINSAITPFTHLAAQFALNKPGHLTATNIDAALTQIQDLFDLPALNATQPADASLDLSTKGLDAQRYALLNAAIGQLAGSVGGIGTKLDGLVALLNANGGQLPSSGSAGLDLADVLRAAQDVVNSGKVAGINSLISTALAENIQVAELTTGNTTATPSDTSGAADLAKAKAFVTSAGQLAAQLRTLDDQSAVDGFRAKIHTIDTMATENGLISQATVAAFNLLLQAAEAGTASKTFTVPEVQAMLDATRNPRFPVTAQNDVRLVVNTADNSVSLSGELVVKPTTSSWNGTTWVLDTPKGFTVTNLKLSYPGDAVSTNTYTLSLLANASIKSGDVALTIPALTSSHIQVTFPTAKTFADRQLDMDGLNPELPTAITAKLDQMMLTALNAPATEFSRFSGTMSLNVVQGMLDVSHGGGQRAWPLPTLAQMKGIFTSNDGLNSMDASASIDLTGSNPKVSPLPGHVRSNLFTYQYNTLANQATLTASTGLFVSDNAWGGSPTLTLKMAALSPTCLIASYPNAPFGDWLLGCFGKTTVSESLSALLSLGYTPYQLQVFVTGEGYYQPVLTGLTANTTATAANGTLLEGNELFEDATHFGKGTISLTTKVKLSGATPVDLDATITAKRTAIDGGGLTAAFRLGADQMTLTAPVIGGKAVYTLTNKDGVSVEVSAVDTQDKIAIKLNGKEYGWLYTLNGLPVAKFTDNSLMAL